MSGLHKTQDTLRRAMEIYKSQVLNERYLDLDTGLFRYPFSITEKDVLKLAGIKSRSTLKASYHDGIRRDLRALVADLKLKTGRGNISKSASLPRKENKKGRVEQLAETIGALQYKIIALQKEIDDLRSSGAPRGTTVNILRRKK